MCEQPELSVSQITDHQTTYRRG